MFTPIQGILIMLFSTDNHKPYFTQIEPNVVPFGKGALDVITLTSLPTLEFRGEIKEEEQRFCVCIVHNKETQQSKLLEEGITLDIIMKIDDRRNGLYETVDVEMGESIKPFTLNDTVLDDNGIQPDKMGIYQQELASLGGEVVELRLLVKASSQFFFELAVKKDGVIYVQHSVFNNLPYYTVQTPTKEIPFMKTTMKGMVGREGFYLPMVGDLNGVLPSPDTFFTLTTKQYHVAENIQQHALAISRDGTNAYWREAELQFNQHAFNLVANTQQVSLFIKLAGMLGVTGKPEWFDGIDNVSRFISGTVNDFQMVFPMLTDLVVSQEGETSLTANGVETLLPYLCQQFIWLQHGKLKLRKYDQEESGVLVNKEELAEWKTLMLTYPVHSFNLSPTRGQFDWAGRELTKVTW